MLLNSFETRILSCPVPTGHLYKVKEMADQACHDCPSTAVRQTCHNKFILVFIHTIIERRFRFLCCLFLFVTNTFASFLWDENLLKENKTRLQTADFKSAYSALIRKADKMIQEHHVSVMDKKHIPISGDKHDYMSLSRYYWPNPNTENGLPYISKDGKTNPEIKEYDRETLEKMSVRVRTLALAYFFSENEKYALAGIEQIKVWFSNTKTKMNPNMNYAQIIPGKNGEKGNAFGVLDGYSFVEMLDGVLLLEQSENFSSALKKEMRQWFKEYVHWLLNSEQGQQERNAKNNHGTTFDTQLLTYAFFVQDFELAKTIFNNFGKRRVKTQIDVDGKQAQELKRTRSFHYSWYNVSHILDFYIVAQNNGLDVANELATAGVNFKRALDFLYQYVKPNAAPWPYTEISNKETIKKKIVQDLCRFYLMIDSSQKEYFDLFLQQFEKFKGSVFILLYGESATFFYPISHSDK